ncbi:MAG: 30S ribosomal protein S3 [Candidatus Aenigmatarchaeota archaeon]|nr:30S ribosomal protein S3 [Candidatus Aenigmarchaeota archaeon]
MKEKKIVQDKIKRMMLEEFLKKEFSKAGYSKCEIQHTPLATRIIIWVQKPGIIIGRSGKTIEYLTEVLKSQFNIENPQFEIEEVKNPFTDAQIVADYIASAIQRGLNYKKVINTAIQNCMAAGAIGIAVRISGKLGGAMGRTEKFSAGYLKFAGAPADNIVQKAYSKAQVKLGTIGIQVRILNEKPEELLLLEKITQENLSDAHGNNKEKTT